VAFAMAFSREIGTHHGERRVVEGTVVEFTRAALAFPQAARSRADNTSATPERTHA
jgi:hypothetical protein